MNDEQLFQLGRRWVTSLMQSITVNEFVPALTGKAVAKYKGYKPQVNGRLALEFEQSLYRVGHTLLTRELGALWLSTGAQSAAGRSISASLCSRRRSSTRRPRIWTPWCAGSFARSMRRFDGVVADGVRNTLIVDQPGVAGTLFDLPAINIMRGRELGLPSYNETRQGFGLPRVASDGRRLQCRRRPRV